MVSEKKQKKRKVSRTGKPCAFGEAFILYFGWGQVLASFIEIVADGFTRAVCSDGDCSG